MDFILNEVSNNIQVESSLILCRVANKKLPQVSLGEFYSTCFQIICQPGL